MNIDLSIVVPVYNEESVLTFFLDELILQTQNISKEIIVVNDGSIDNSLKIAIEFSARYEFIRVINFSRNFGHEAAMIAGIDYASGEAIICLDSDMQHPPVLIPQMFEQFKQGYEIINMVRKERLDGGFFKYLSSKLFYVFLNKLTPINFEPNASDFFLISKRCSMILKSHYRERTRFLRGFIQTIGFKKTKIEFTAPKRYAGESKYSLWKLFLFSISAIVSFSKLPLRIGSMFGLIFGLFSFVLGVYSVVMKFLENPVSGYTTIVVMIGFSFSVLFFILGILGEYLGCLFEEIKGRPIYIVESEHGLMPNTQI